MPIIGHELLLGFLIIIIFIVCQGDFSIIFIYNNYNSHNLWRLRPSKHDSGTQNPTLRNRTDCFQWESFGIPLELGSLFQVFLPKYDLVHPVNDHELLKDMFAHGQNGNEVSSEWLSGARRHFKPLWNGGFPGFPLWRSGKNSGGGDIKCAILSYVLTNRMNPLFWVPWTICLPDFILHLLLTFTDS